MVDWSLVLDGLVAVGTIVLAGAAFRQMKITERNRKRERAIQRLEGTYAPLREDAETWTSGREIWDNASFENVRTIRRQPSLFWSLPEDLRELVDRAADIGESLPSLREDVRFRVQQVMDEWSEERVSPEDDGWDGGHDTTIKLWLEPREAIAGFHEVDPLFLWLSDQEVRTYCREVTERNLADDWYIRVSGRGQRFEGIDKAEDVIGRVHESLEDWDRAEHLRGTVNELLGVGQRLREKLSDEIEDLRETLA